MFGVKYTEQVEDNQGAALGTQTVETPPEQPRIIA